MVAIDMDDLVEQLGVAVSEASLVYLPALQRMAMDELTALARELAEGRTDEAHSRLHAAMTPDELAGEKEQLADLAELMAADNARARRLGQEIMGAVVRGAFWALLASAGF